MSNPVPYSVQAKTFTISATDTASTAAQLQGVGQSIRLTNESTSPCFVAVSTSSSVAATLPVASSSASSAVATCTPILAGEDITFTVPDQATLYISAICRSGASATLDVSRGNGI